VFGYGASAVAKPLIALARTPVAVLALWLFDRTGKGVRGAPRDGIIADSTAEEVRGRAYGLHRAMDTAGAVVGPLLAMALLWYAGTRSWDDAVKYRSVFWLAAIPGMLAAVVALVFVRERQAASRVTKAPSERERLDRRFFALIVVLGVFALGNSADAFLVLRSKDLGMRPEWIPGLFLVMSLVTASTSSTTD
jgi:MFS family permease